MTSFFRRGASLGVIAAALAVCLTGCPTRYANNGNRTTNFSGAIVNGVGAAQGPDAQSGSGNTTIVSTASGVTGGATVSDNDFALLNDSIILNFDAIGMDTHSFLSLTQAGVPISTIAAPSGGNLVDIQLQGTANDQFDLNAQAVVGFTSVTNNATITNPLVRGNVIFNYEIVPDSDPAFNAFLAQNPIGQGLAAAGVATADFNMRRMLVKGVILHLVTQTAEFDGTATVSAGTVQAAAALLPPGTIPSTFLVNVPSAFPVVVKIVQGAPIPIFVTTVYSLASSSREFSILTVIANPDPLKSTVGISSVMDIVVSGGGADQFKNMDVLAGGPTVVPAGGPVVNRQPTGGNPSAPFPGNFVQPVIFNSIINAILAGLGAPPTITIPEQTFGIGAAPYVTFVGRDEPGVSYTWFDPNVGQLIVQRQLQAATAIVQVRPNHDIGATGSFSHLRFVAVGGRNDASSSSDIAVIGLRNQAVATRGSPGSPNTANSFLNVATARGRILHAPPGTLVTISEVRPFFFAPFNFTGPFLPNAFGGQPDPFLNHAGFFGPAAVVPGVIGAIPANVVNEVLRTTAIPAPDGQWAATVPVGFDVTDAALGQAPQAIPVSITQSAYHVQYLLPGSTTPLEGGTATAVVGVPVIDFGFVDARTANIAFVDFEILDATPGRQLTRIPGKVSVIPTSGTLPLGFSLGNPTGISEPLERATGAGNVVVTASGFGRITLASGIDYTLVTSQGTEWEATTTHVGVLSAGQLLSLTAGNAIQLVQIVNPSNAISFDGHVHSGNSFDSATPFADRVRSLLAAGIGAFAATEHDRIIDPTAGMNEVAAERSDLRNRLKAMSGTEATALVPFPPLGGATGGIGHYTSFPLQFGSTLRKGGSPEDEFRPTSVLVQELRGLAEGGGDDIVNLAHPRLPIESGVAGLFSSQGYFNNLAASGFQTFPFAFDDFNAPALELMLTDHAGFPLTVQQNFFINGSLTWDTFEIMTGASTAEAANNYVNVRRDFFDMLNRGIVKTILGNSDCHLISSNDVVRQMGFPRNYLLIPGGTPATVLDSDIVNALKPAFQQQTTVVGNSFTSPTGAPPVAPAAGTGHQKAFATTGPFISSCTVQGVGGNGAVGTIGDFISPGATGTVLALAVTVTVDAPAFIMTELNSATVNAVAWCNGAAFAMTEVTAQTTPTHKVFTTTITANNIPFPQGPFSSDAWVVVEVGKALGTTKTSAPGFVTPGSTYDAVAPGAMVIAVTNPIFVDLLNVTGHAGVFDAVQNDF